MSRQKAKQIVSATRLGPAHGPDGPSAVTSDPSGSVEVPPGFWQREISHCPRPMTPLGSSFLLETLNQNSKELFADLGILLESLEFREIRGYVYQTLKPLVGDASARRLPPKPLLWLALRLHPRLRRRIARCKHVMETRLDRQIVDRWYEDWRPKLIEDIERWRSMDLTSLSDRALAAHLSEIRDWAHASIGIHSQLGSACAGPLGLLAFFCRDNLGYEDGQVLVLLSGLSGASSEPALELAMLAGRIRADSELTRAILGAQPWEVPSLMEGASPGLGRAFDDYLDRYGYRALRYELVEQTLGERPELVAELLQDELRLPTGLDAKQETLERARLQAQTEALAALPNETLRDEFRSLLRDAERAYPVREDNEFYTVSVPFALVRFAVLEASQRLTRGGMIAEPEDAFFLLYDELTDALGGGQTVYPVTIDRRRTDFAAAEAFDPPGSYGEQPPQPPLDVLPPESRLAMEVGLYFMERVFEPERSNDRNADSPGEVKGVGASRGTYTGRACVVLGEEQFDKLQPGDVLVCPITSPVWSILFAKIGALVTDTGGILSHPAIIAREYGVPAVVATGNATRVISDGRQVSVDGNAGVVRLLDERTSVAGSA
ncbi:MAG: PEP-utilizing enzyme [Dehalococcoidia bacterium]